MQSKSGNKLKLLIVEDDVGLRTQLQWALADFELFMAEDREAAMTLFRREEPPVIILDLGLPPDRDNASEGLAVLRGVLALRPLTKVIISSGNEDRNVAIEAVSSGAYDYYSKPADQNVLRIIIQRAWNSYQLEMELAQARNRLQAMESASGFIGASPEIVKVRSLAERVAPSDVGVVILGESGTGKDVLARSIHGWSNRADQPFVVINCAAIPENLLESELFGHEKGAFTGAHSQVIGKVELANKGTLFLDEIGDMPLVLQAKLLRFLQEKSIERVGGRKSINVDVRVLAATNKDLRTMMKEGTFREDLFFRLNEVNISLPPLRQRSGDAVLIATYLLKKARSAAKKPIKGFSREALALIETYNWPGNVRELENRIKRAVIMANQAYVMPEDLDLDNAEAAGDSTMLPTLREVREDAERRALSRTLAVTNNNIQEASKLLGVSRPTIYSLIKTFGLGK